MTMRGAVNMPVDVAFYVGTRSADAAILMTREPPGRCMRRKPPALRWS
jgi:hypothetical protein